MRGSHKKRRYKRWGVAGMLALGVGAFWATRDRTAVGHWRSEDGRRRYLASYAQAMRLLPHPTRSLDLETSFGTVRVYEFANERNAAEAPIVLLPGRSSGTPMWSANLRELAEHRTVYALDALGDAGLSVHTRAFGDEGDLSAWLHEALSKLQLRPTHLVVHSFGGWLAARYAVDHPEMLASLTLLEPVLVLQPLRWQIYVKTIPASLPFLPSSWRSKMLADIGGVSEIDLNDPVTRMIADATEHYAAKLPVPKQLTSRQLNALKIPVYIGMGEKSSLHDAAAAVEVARTMLPSGTARLWLGATHSLPMELPEQVNREILAFMTGHER